MLGKTVSHYRILSTLGKGGMGVVYKAEDTRLGRAVAVKFVPEAYAHNRVALERFQREARAASALNHPNICTVHDIGESEYGPFLVMECLEGMTLAQRIAAAPIPIEDAIEFAIQIADALDAAHSHSIAHRDIKPANLFITSRGHIKIMDFGLAKLTRGTASNPSSDSQVDTRAMQEAVTNPGAAIGTVAYMSPEQASGEELDGRTDLFSFGVVLYEMLARISPFHGATTAVIYAAILHRNPVPPSTVRAEIIPELDRIILKLLEKDPTVRYQTAAEVRADLKRLRRDSGYSNRFFDAETAGASLPVARPMTGSSGGATSQPATAAAAMPSRRAMIAAACLGLAASAGVYYFAIHEKALDSIAVLPFTNATGDPNTEYLSDGIAESIINGLSQVNKLEVRSFSSTERFKGKSVSPDEAGRQLKVRAVLTGRLVRRGDEFAISTELIEVSRNRQLWGNQYTVKAADLLATQEQIARQISERLRLQLTGADKERLTHHSTEDAEAYQLYLQGRFQWNKRTLEGLQGSIDLFQQAIQKDPRYALAYAGQADAYASIAEFNVLPAREVMPKVRTAAAKAIELDDNLAEAHTSLAWARFHDWDWSSTEREFKRAIALNPAYPTAHVWYADYLDAMGRFDESAAELDRAVQSSPLSPVVNSAVASRLYFARQFDAAIDQCRKTLSLEHSFVPAHLLLGRAQLQKKQFAEAAASLKRALDLSEGDNDSLAAVGYSEALARHSAETKKILDQLKERAQQTYVQPLALATIYIGLGDNAQAFDALAKAIDDRSVALVFLKVDPVFDPIRTDPRFTDLLQRIGLPAK